MAAGSFPVVRELIALGANICPDGADLLDVYLRGTKGYPHRPRAPLLRALLNGGVQPSMPHLTRAARLGLLSSVRELLPRVKPAAGADRAALLAACVSYEEAYANDVVKFSASPAEYVETLYFLLSKGVPQAAASAALLVAARAGRALAVRLLLAAGAEGASDALAAAAADGAASVACPSNDDYVVGSCAEGSEPHDMPGTHIGVVRELLAAGARVALLLADAAADVLRLAAAHADVALVRDALAAGADVNAVDGRGFSPLHYASGGAQFARRPTAASFCAPSAREGRAATRNGPAGPRGSPT